MVTVRVGLIGEGAIGGEVASALTEGRIEGAVLGGILTRSGGSGRCSAIQELLDGSDLIVEVAGQAAVVEHGPTVIGSGRELLVVSVGALVDRALLDRLRSGPGRLSVSSGAIGGLDALRAAMLATTADGYGLEQVEVVTTKPPGALLEDWMDADLRSRLAAGTERIEVFRGSASEAVTRFPRSVNVSATLGLATLGMDRTRVTVVADPAVEENEHRILATGAVGTYEFVLRNAPSPDNPRTSRLTALSVLRWIAERAGGPSIGA